MGVLGTVTLILTGERSRSRHVPKTPTEVVEALICLSEAASCSSSRIVSSVSWETGLAAGPRDGVTAAKNSGAADVSSGGVGGPLGNGMGGRALLGGGGRAAGTMCDCRGKLARGEDTCRRCGKETVGTVGDWVCARGGCTEDTRILPAVDALGGYCAADAEDMDSAGAVDGRDVGRYDIDAVLRT